MLQRLRQHAAGASGNFEHERTMVRHSGVEEGSDDPKQRYEIVDEADRDYKEMDDEDDEEEDATDSFTIIRPEAVNATGTDVLTPPSSQVNEKRT
jgi:hypothetical protein